MSFVRVNWSVTELTQLPRGVHCMSTIEPLWSGQPPTIAEARKFEVVRYTKPG
jgi:hypothetical protein